MYVLRKATFWYIPCFITVRFSPGVKQVKVCFGLRQYVINVKVCLFDRSIFKRKNKGWQWSNGLALQSVHIASFCISKILSTKCECPH